MSTDDHVFRSVRAALSLYVGGALPEDLRGTAEAHGLPTDGWVFPPEVATISDVGRDLPTDLLALGGLLLDQARQAGITQLVPGDPGWPAGTGCDALPCLWVIGDADVAGLLRESITVTGAAGGTPYGKHAATGLAYALATYGWTVTASAATGTDAHAALAARAAGRPVLLVVANGLDQSYPAELTGLLQDVAEHGGLVSRAPPQRWQANNASPPRPSFPGRGQPRDICDAPCPGMARDLPGVANTPLESQPSQEETVSLPDINELQDLLTPLFQAMEWAEEEIESARRRHRYAADRIWHSFLLLTPTHDLMSRSEAVYRSHCRELLDRVARREDTRPGTAAECCIALSETSLRAPLNTSAAGLYSRMWTLAQLPPIEMTDSSVHYEALEGSSIDQQEAWLRHKLRQQSRITATTSSAAAAVPREAAAA